MDAKFSAGIDYATFDRIEKHTKRRLNQTAKAVADEGADTARKLAPRKTGALQRSIRGSAVDGNTARWGSPLPHARYQERGTRPHDIPASPGYLSFYWERRGRWFGPPYPNQVSHPGNPARRFLYASLVLTAPKVNAIARRFFSS